MGFVVAEVSPYEVDLEWDDLTEPDEMGEVVELLGRATAKVHCSSDEDSDHDLVDFQVEDAVTTSLASRRRAFADHLVQFATDYAAQVREDHAIFVEEFRAGRIGVAAT